MDANRMWFIAALLLLALAIPTHAWSFTDVCGGCYTNARNITFNSWNYTSNTVSQVSTFALINFTNVGTPGSLTFAGYGTNGQFLGFVPFWLLKQNGNSIAVLLQNQTSGISYNTITLFYNPIPNVPFIAGHGLQGTFYSQVYANQTFSFILNNMSSTNVPSIPFKLTPVYSNSIYAIINFTLKGNPFLASQPLGNGAFVLLANSSMQSRYFNASWNPNLFNTYNIGSFNSIYRLSSLGLLPVFVSSNSLVSNNAKKVFNNNDGKGFEAFFSTFGNVISSGSMGEVTTLNLANIFNSTASQLVTLNLNTKSQFFNVKVIANTPTSYMILPSFTTNVVVSNVITNNNPINPNLCTNPKCFFGLKYALPFTAINWTFNFTTSANVIVKRVVFGANNVPFLLLKVPYVQEFGSACQNTFFDVYANSTNIDYGSVPYYIYNCSGTTATFLLTNTTSLGFTFNNVTLYYGVQSSSAGFFPSGFNTIVLNKFVIAKTTSSNAIIGGSNIPYVVNTTPISLTLNGMITTSPFYNAFGQNVYARFGNDGNPYLKEFSYNGGGFQTIQIHDYTGIPNLNYLVWQNTTYTEAIYTKTLAATWVNIGLDLFTANVYNVSAVSSAALYYVPVFAPDLNYTLPHINATFKKLWTSQARAGIVRVNGNVNNVTVTCQPPLIISGCNTTHVTSTVPVTSNGIIYNNTTTINFNADNSIVMLGDTGIAIPFSFLIFIQIIAVIVSLSVYDVGGHILSVVILIGVWIIGVFNIQLLGIALIGTLLLMAEYFLLENKRHPKDRTSVEVHAHA